MSNSVAHFRLSVLIGILLFGSYRPACAGPPGREDGHGGAVPERVNELIEAFFRSDDSRERSQAASSIIEAAEGDFDLVARALKHISLWSSLPTSRGTFAVPSDSVGAIRVAYAVPEDYDPAKAYPIMVCMPDEGDTADSAFAAARSRLGASLRGFVLLSPQAHIDGAFLRFPEDGGDLRRLLRRARRVIHVDSDRVFLFGRGRGADAAWMAAISYPDLLAGVVVVSGYPDVPYPRQAYPLLFENIRVLPILSVWLDAGNETPAGRGAAVAAYNRAIAEFAKEAALPVTGVELSPDDPPAVPADAAAALLGLGRAEPGRRVSHWFRSPSQAKSGWLAREKHAGEVWAADQLSIIASAGTDRDAWIRKVLAEKLGYLGGRIDGQTITVDVRHCARIAVLLSDGMIDWEKPVTIICNGRTRHEGVIKRSIATLLNHARKTWDFQRLVYAELSFSIRDDAPLPWRDDLHDGSDGS